MLPINLYKDAFERLKNNPAYAPLAAANPAAIQPSFLRMEAIVANNKTEFQFYVSNTAQGDISLTSTSTEKRLDRNNHFVALEHRFGIYERDSAVLQNSKEDVYAPVPGYFTAGTTFKPSDLEWLYKRGRMLIQVSTNVYVNGGIGLADFRYVPQTQTATLDDGTTTTTTDAKTQSPFGGGWQPLALPVSFFGNQDNKLSIICPTPAGIDWAQDAANKEVVLVWEVRGLEIVNVLR
jgi:hypothetical protein